MKKDGAICSTDKLIALEEIRALLARRVRCVDEKDWAGFADCYTEDAVSWSFQTLDEPGAATVGNAVIAQRVAEYLADKTTVHQIHLPEIEMTGPDSAHGIVPLEDILVWEEDGTPHWLRGYGHYRQTYSKVDDRWRISEHRLTRLHVLTGTGPLA